MLMTSLHSLTEIPLRLQVLAPVYMPDRPPTPEHLDRVRSIFAGRRGVPNVAMAVDGTHIPYKPKSAADKEKFRNYKGWYSILLVAYVNSLHLFVNPFVAGPGKNCDSGALKRCTFLERLSDPAQRLLWLGEDGLVAGDGGTSDEQGILLTPIPGATEVEDLWYNFCHSSTRFFVEEVFGRLKNRFRILLLEMHMPYVLAGRIIASTTVLHNYITVTAVADHDTFTFGRYIGWDMHFERYKPMLCPSCTRSFALHCPHIEKNRKAKPMKATACGNANRLAMRDLVWNAAQADGLEYMQVMLEARERRDAMVSARSDDQPHPSAPVHDYSSASDQEEAEDAAYPCLRMRDLGCEV